MSYTQRKSKGQPSLSYSEHSGSGPVLLLLHGVTRCGGDWDQLLSYFATNWRVITLDQRGHGGSDRAESYLVTDYVADAVRFVRDEVASSVVILGHSLGAMVAAAIAAELPQQVMGIVLEDPPYHTMGNRISGSAWQAQFTGMQQVALRGGSLTDLIDALAEILIPAGGSFRRLGELRDRASLAWSAECLSHLDPEVLTPVIAGCWLDGYDIRKTLSHIRCPTLLLQGDPACGGALNDADAEALVAAVSICKHVRFSGSGHQLHRDRTADVLHAFDQFINSLDFAGSSPAANSQ